MTMRIRTQWKRNSGEKTVEDSASALAYIAWQIALTTAKNLHSEGFDYESDEQRVDVIAEYLIYLIHITDRLSYAVQEDPARKDLVTLVARKVAQQYQKNVEEVLGTNDYTSAFLGKLNTRVAEYSSSSFRDQTPSYDMRRLLGYAVQEIMGVSQTNKWVLDQVIEIDSLEMVGTYVQSYNKLVNNKGALDSMHQ
ncbi:MAG: hypothetical protein QNI91_18115 [Arenicellales bacterium]|nr:hypothetical protein [Arenicellales bacterium]